ncbi:MAG: LLM class flavin-dependent oxidoreductase [Candidatus Binataceae bacterium]
MLKYSLQLNNRLAFAFPEYGFGGLLRLAEMADDSPFELILVGDSLFDSPRFEPIATLGAVAARTKKVKFGAAIIQPHFRNPLLLALSWATLDIAGGGRTVLALGIGGGPPAGVEAECREVGIAKKDRGMALERCVLELRALWTGEHPRVNLPVRPAGKVPIWIASGIYQPKGASFSAQSGNMIGEGDAYLPGALDRVARLADGWVTIMATPDELKRSLKALGEGARRHGRDPGAITSVTDTWINVGPDPARCREAVRHAMHHYFNGAPVSEETVTRWSITGPPEVCRQRLAEFEQAGVNQVELVIADPVPFRQYDLIVNKVLS